MTTDGEVVDTGLKSIRRTFAIIEEVDRRGVTGITELADHFDVSKSVVHNHLSTLEDLGYVTRDGQRYRLGLRFLGLGGNVREHSPMYKKLYQSAKTEMDDLARETGEVVNLIVEEGGRGYILYQARGADAVPYDSYLGKEIPLHCTSGKAIIAHYPRERVDEILDAYGLPAVTPSTITDREAFYEELEEIRETGVSFVYAERTPGINVVGVPIRKGEEFVAALSISGPDKRMHGDRLETEARELVQQVGRIVELSFTYS